MLTSPCSARHSVLEPSQESQVEDLQLVVQFHADDTVVSVDAQQDPCRLTVLSQDHFHLDAHTQKISVKIQQLYFEFKHVAI